MKQRAPTASGGRGSSVLGGLGVSLLLLGLGAVLLSGSFGDPPEISLVGRDAPVNVGAQGVRDISAHNSPTLIHNPVRRANLAVASRIDTPFFSCALHVSFDGGKSWSRTPIPAPKGEEPKYFAPYLAFTRGGTLHVSFVTLKGRGNVPQEETASESVSESPLR